MGGTGRSKRRMREEAHGTGLEHTGAADRLTPASGQRDRSRRRRLAYKLEKKGKDLSESAELAGLNSRVKRQRKIQAGKTDRRKKPATQPEPESDEQLESDDAPDEEVIEVVDNTPAFSDHNSKWLKVKDITPSVKKGKTKPSAAAISTEAIVIDDDSDASDVQRNGTTDDHAADNDDSAESDADADEGGEGGDKDGSEDGGEESEVEEVEESDPNNERSGVEQMDLDSGDEDAELPPDKLEMESEKILQKRQEDEEDAQAEEKDEVTRAQEELVNFKLDTGVLGRGGRDGDEETAATRDELMVTIRGILYILLNFKSRGEEGKSRQEYLSAFRKAICECFQYNEELAEMLMDVFPRGDIVDFMEASESPRPLTIRTNTLIARRRELAQALISRGMNVDPMDKWSKVGLVVYESQVPVGATPEYLGGYYMIQSASSFLPVVALAPRENERILDMAAAPGGKATYIGAALKNTGVLVANDLKRDRIKSLVANVHRLGLTNAIVCNYNGTEIPGVFGGCFDRVLLDAPCSGTGIICHDGAVKMNRRRDDVQRTTKIQKELILAAIDSVNVKSKNGGYVVYSTCSVLVEENEAVVDYAMRYRHVKIVASGIPFGLDGHTTMKHQQFHRDMSLARRIYPHVHNLDGFFVCKLKKVSDRKGLKKAPTNA